MTKHPIYTKDFPVLPGLYWYRVGPSKVDRNCRVWKMGNKLVAPTDGGSKDVKLFQRSWAGPLLEPR